MDSQPPPPPHQPPRYPSHLSAPPIQHLHPQYTTTPINPSPHPISLPLSHLPIPVPSIHHHHHHVPPPASLVHHPPLTLHPDQTPPDPTPLALTSHHAHHSHHSHHLPSLPPAHHIHPPTSTTTPTTTTQPPPHFYEHPYSASARIAHLEADLENARAEIERLKLKLADLEKDRPKSDSPKVQSRYWTPNEHKRFLEALQKFGPKDVRAIASYVGSRNATQVRTHAQKYFLRVAREAKQGTNALHAARKRSMSESDLVRVGRAVRTPPGSPNMRDNKSVSAAAPTSSPPPPPTLLPPVHADVHMTPVPMNAVRPYLSPVQSTTSLGAASVPPVNTTAAFGPGPGAAAPGANGASSRALVFAPAQKKPDAPANAAVSSGAKPPVGVAKLSDNTGMNLLSMVATERKMEVDKGIDR